MGSGDPLSLEYLPGVYDFSDTGVYTEGYL